MGLVCTCPDILDARSDQGEPGVVEVAQRRNAAHRGLWSALACGWAWWLWCFSFWSSPDLSAQTGRAASSAPPQRYLFVVETSRAMRNRAAGTFDVMRDLLNSSFQGRLQSGDTVGIWTFNDRLDAGSFGFQEWSAKSRLSLVVRLLDFVRAQKYEKRANLDKVLPAIEKICSGSDPSTVVLICSGEQDIQGTLFDVQINEAYRRWWPQQDRAQMPLVTVLQASRGQITAWSVTPAPAPVELPAQPGQSGPVASDLSKNGQTVRDLSPPAAVPPADRTASAAISAAVKPTEDVSLKSETAGALLTTPAPLPGLGDSDPEEDKEPEPTPGGLAEALSSQPVEAPAAINPKPTDLVTDARETGRPGAYELEPIGENPPGKPQREELLALASARPSPKSLDDAATGRGPAATSASAPSPLITPRTGLPEPNSAPGPRHDETPPARIQTGVVVAPEKFSLENAGWLTLMVLAAVGTALCFRVWLRGNQRPQVDIMPYFIPPRPDEPTAPRLENPPPGGKQQAKTDPIQ